MENGTYMNDQTWLNQPISNQVILKDSILPERFRSTSEPSDISILGGDLNSVTEPQISDE
jgi:hypothetical protein